MIIGAVWVRNARSYCHLALFLSYIFFFMSALLVLSRVPWIAVRNQVLTVLRFSQSLLFTETGGHPLCCFLHWLLNLYIRTEAVPVGKHVDGRCCANSCMFDLSVTFFFFFTEGWVGWNLVVEPLGMWFCFCSQLFLFVCGFYTGTATELHNRASQLCTCRCVHTYCAHIPCFEKGLLFFSRFFFFLFCSFSGRNVGSEMLFCFIQYNNKKRWKARFLVFIGNGLAMVKSAWHGLTSSQVSVSTMCSGLQYETEHLTVMQGLQQQSWGLYC